MRVTAAMVLGKLSTFDFFIQQQSKIIKHCSYLYGTALEIPSPNASSDPWHCYNLKFIQTGITSLERKDLHAGTWLVGLMKSRADLKRCTH